MKLQLIILFCALKHFSFSQTQIKIISPQRQEGNYYSYDYKLLKPEDTAYVVIHRHQEDMGVPYSGGYELKLNISDGCYEIYLDDTLDFKAFIKNHKRDGIWIYYYPNGKIKSIAPFKNGLINGDYIEYYEDSSLSNTKTVNGKVKSSRVYFTSGKIKHKFIYKNGKLIKQFTFNEKGEKIVVYDRRSKYDN